MGEPHARRGRRARTRSSRIANVRQKETREIETMPRRGEDNPCETCRNSDCKGTWGGDAGIQTLFIVKNIIFLVLRLPLNLLNCMYSH